MVIFVYGDDEMRVAEKLAQLRSHFLAKIDPAGLNLAEFPAAGSSQIPFADVAQAVGSAPFLAAKRMVVVRGLFTGLKKAEAKEWAAFFRRTPESTIVVFVDAEEGKNIEKHELYVSLKDKAEVHSYVQPKLEGSALARALVERATALGGTLALDVTHELTKRIGNEMWQLQHEVEKLVAYANGTPITLAMLDLLVVAHAESAPFAFLDALSQKDAKASIRLLAKEREAGAADLYLLAMIARQVRILLQVRQLLAEQPKANAAKELGLHPFVAQKALGQAKHFDSPTLLRVHAVLVELDREAKRGRIAPSLAVDRAVAEMVVA